MLLSLTILYIYKCIELRNCMLSYLVTSLVHTNYFHLGVALTRDSFRELFELRMSDDVTVM